MGPGSSEMMPASLSRTGKAYVYAVATAGGGVVIYSLLQLGLSPPHPYWLLLAALTLSPVPSRFAFPRFGRPSRLPKRSSLRWCCSSARPQPPWPWPWMARS